MKFLKLLILVLIFTANVSADSGHIKINNNLTNKDWSFLPDIPSSFDTSSVNNFEFLFTKQEFGFLFEQSELELDVVRLTEPRLVKLLAEKEKYEFFYFLSPQSAVSFATKKQLSDRQAIDCYAFGNLVIGSCNTSDLRISNSNEEYNKLNGSILMIDGRNESKALNYNVVIDSFLTDELSIGFEQTKNQYFWITPLEGITSNFILNINIDGKTLGNLIDNTLATLPQRKSWTTNQINMTIKKEFKLSYDAISLFYEMSALYIDHGKYKSITDLPNSNFKLMSGLRFDIDPIVLSFYGNYFHNNLLGYEPITLNQRTEHYFTQHFGSLGLELKYKF